MGVRGVNPERTFSALEGFPVAKNGGCACFRVGTGGGKIGEVRGWVASQKYFFYFFFATSIN